MRSISMMRDSRASWLKIIYRYSSSSRRSLAKKNHYDSLEINSSATHTEIKSAYFKLSKQYHPDMNKTPEAKLKFNDISSAYEVLGNHGRRKQYDRGLRISPIASHEPDITMTKTDINDIHEEAKRVHTAIYRNRKQADGTPIYDFDAWSEAHYGKVFEKRQRELSRARMYILNREKERKNTPMQNEVSILSVLILLLFMMVAIRIQLDDLDRPRASSNEGTVAQDSENISESQS